MLLLFIHRYAERLLGALQNLNHKVDSISQRLDEVEKSEHLVKEQISTLEEQLGRRFKSVESTSNEIMRNTQFLRDKAEIHEQQKELESFQQKEKSSLQPKAQVPMAP